MKTISYLDLGMPTDAYVEFEAREQRLSRRQRRYRNLALVGFVAVLGIGRSLPHQPGPAFWGYAALCVGAGGVGARFVDSPWGN